MPLVYTKLLSVIDDYLANKTPLVFYWDDGCVIKARNRTGTEEFCDFLEEDDENYLEYYAIGVEILEVIALPVSPRADLIKETLENGYWLEISAELNEPSKIEKLDGRVIWQRGDEIPNNQAEITNATNAAGEAVTKTSSDISLSLLSVDVDPQEFLNQFAGKGKRVTATKEIIDYGSVVGKYYDREKEQYVKTTMAMIHYDTKGTAYVVPIRPNG